MPAERTSVIRLFWITMSIGPRAVPPAPSITFTPRITSLLYGPLPSSGPRGGVACAPALAGSVAVTSSAAPSARMRGAMYAPWI